MPCLHAQNCEIVISRKHLIVSGLPNHFWVSTSQHCQNVSVHHSSAATGWQSSCNALSRQLHSSMTPKMHRTAYCHVVQRRETVQHPHPHQVAVCKLALLQTVLLKVIHVSPVAAHRPPSSHVGPLQTPLTPSSR